MTTLGPDLELQGAVVAALSANAELKTLIGTTPRIYQDVPASAAFPYLVVGDSQRVNDSVQGMASEEIYITIHIWTRQDSSPGVVDAKKIESIIKNLLHDASLSLTENRCVLIEFDSARNGSAESPDLRHRVLTMRALTDPAA